MKINYFKLSDNSLQPVQENISPIDWDKKVNWVDIRTENRVKVSNYLEKHHLLKHGRDFIEHPENYSQPKIIRDIRIFNIGISNSQNINDTDFITVIMTKDVIVTIMPNDANMLYYKSITLESTPSHSLFLYYFFYRMISDILTQNHENSVIARNHLHKFEDLLAYSPKDLKPSQIMEIKRYIGHLADIIEDQSTTFNTLASLNVNVHYVENIKNLKELIKGFIPLNKTMLRLEEKAESIHSYFMLIQQDKATHKINVLTVIQAVFVPLTFIAGVYGMNFLNMPELHWQYGYFITVVSFVLIAAFSLYFFYKKGWFD